MIENENKQQEAVTETAVPAEEINTAETPKPETDNEQVAENVEKTDDAAELPKAETVAVSEDATDNAAVSADEAASSEEEPADESSEAETVQADETAEIVGIRFKKSGKIYYFDPDGIECEQGGHAVVETARGVEYGSVTIANRRVPVSELVLPLRKILRKATPEDDIHHEENLKAEKEAFDVCLEKIHAHNMSMKLIDVEYTFDNNKLLFYFTADGRVDFRELVKDLASVFRTRIELRQIGIRDEAKLMGGLGVCGRTFCCHSFLPDFAQVSIKMAKEQNLSLNSAKISGACGRLMCCLRYENDVYEEEAAKLPKLDQVVQTTDGDGVVIEVQALAGKVRVKLNVRPEVPPKYFTRDEIIKVKGFAHTPHDDVDDEELRSLEADDNTSVSDSGEGSRSSRQSGRERGDQRRGNRYDRQQGGGFKRNDRNAQPENSEHHDAPAERPAEPEAVSEPETAEKQERPERPERSERPDRRERERHDRRDRDKDRDKDRQRPERRERPKFTADDEHSKSENAPSEEPQTRRHNDAQHRKPAENDVLPTSAEHMKEAEEASLHADGDTAAAQNGESANKRRNFRQGHHHSHRPNHNRSPRPHNNRHNNNGGEGSAE